MASSPRVVLFDFGGTLDGPGLPWKERMRRLYRDEGVDVTPQRFDPVFYHADDALVGTIPTTMPFDETVRRIVDGIDAALDCAPAGPRVAKRFVDDAVTTAERHASVLAGLARRCRLGIVSNFYGNLDTVCADLGLARFFDVVVDSARVGATKPDARIFHATCASVGVPADAVLHVGDDPDLDVRGALAAGIRSAWVNRHARPWPGDPVDTLELRDLLALCDLLGV